MQQTKIILCGALGHMGQAVSKRAAQPDAPIQIVAGVDIRTDTSGAFPVYASFEDISEDADVIVDFSRAAALPGLLGRERVRAILVNVVLPLFAREDPAAARLAEAVPGEALSAPMRETAFRLLGGDHNPALYAGRALRMQGLLELWRGFCEASPEACRDCPLARR